MAEQFLDAKGVRKGTLQKGFQYYEFIAEAKDGSLFVFIMACRTMYTDAVEKALSRLHPIFAPTEPEPEPESEEKSEQFSGGSDETSQN